MGPFSDHICISAWKPPHGQNHFRTLYHISELNIHILMLITKTVTGHWETKIIHLQAIIIISARVFFIHAQDMKLPSQDLTQHKNSIHTLYHLYAEYMSISSQIFKFPENKIMLTNTGKKKKKKDTSTVHFIYSNTEHFEIHLP